jgi:hypothetical protein
MSDDELVSFMDERYNDMSTASIRKEKEADRDSADKQFTAFSIRDSY